MMRTTKLFLTLCIVFGCVCAIATLANAQYKLHLRKDWNESMEKRMEWWREARFGMFIHWGLYSVPAGEWGGERTYGEWIMRGANIPIDEYEKFAERFNPVKFNADEWVNIAHKAGMKYIIITTKHHDGFSMFDSKYSDYDIIDSTPFGRDPIKELAEACQRRGIRLGLYYSITDWHHPDFAEKWHGYHGRPNPNANLENYVSFYQNQLRELLTNYGPVSMMWFDDGGSFMTPESRFGGEEMYIDEHPSLIHSEETMKIMRSLQPDIIINDRLGGETADYVSPEEGIPPLRSVTFDLTFEVCMTLNDEWVYNMTDINWKSPKEIVFELVDIASKNGNYLLNVGPTAEGEIHPTSATMLLGAGQWIQRNAEAIYGTTGSLLEQPEWGRLTQREMKDGNTRLYLHVLDWVRSRNPQPRDIVVNGLKNRPIQAYPLTAIPRRYFKAVNKGNSVVVTHTGRPTDRVDTVIVLDVEGKISSQ